MTTSPASGAPRRTIRAIPLPGPCENHLNGHRVHWVQERASRRKGPGQPHTVTDVADDGTITFADGSTCWHHEPHRLRIALANVDSQAELCALGVLRVVVPALVHAIEQVHVGPRGTRGPAARGDRVYRSRADGDLPAGGPRVPERRRVTTGARTRGGG